MEHVSKDELWTQIQEQHSTPAATIEVCGEGGEFPEPDQDVDDPAEIDLPRLRSALGALDPDADDDHTWLAYRMGPLVNAAKARPDLEGDLFALAWHFSSGKLRGKLATKWVKKSEGKDARKGRFSSVWRAFLRSKYNGRRTTIKTIYSHAWSQGWRALDVEPTFDEEQGE